MWVSVCLFGTYMMASVGRPVVALICAIMAAAWIPSRIWSYNKWFKGKNEEEVVVSYFDEWLDDCFSKEDEGKIRSIGCWSYGSSGNKSLEEVRGQLSELGMADNDIAEFVEGVWRNRGRKDSKIELLASIQHDIWAHWMNYMFSEGDHNDDGSWTMPKEKAYRWKRQAATAYADLTEKEKERVRRVQVAKIAGLT